MDEMEVALFNSYNPPERGPESMATTITLITSETRGGQQKLVEVQPWLWIRSVNWVGVGVSFTADTRDGGVFLLNKQGATHKTPGNEGRRDTLVHQQSNIHDWKTVTDTGGGHFQSKTGNKLHEQQRQEMNWLR